MNKGTFNDIIDFEYPDGFKQLSDIENERYFSGNLMRLSFQNKEKHILLSISKTKDSFMNRLVSTASVLANALANLEGGLKDYEFIEEYESEIFELPAMTGCFSYNTRDEDIKQYGELSVFKLRKTFYIIYCLSRFENKDDSKVIFKDFKDSFK